MTRLLTTPLVSKSLVDATTERLEGAILIGEIAAGTKLLEQPLALALGVSRSVIREAIRRLEGRKLVTRTLFVGAQVASLSSEDLKEIMLVRESLEGTAARLAATQMTDRQLRELENVIQKQHDVKGEDGGGARYMEERDYDFHVRIVKGSGNKRILDFLCGDLYYILKVYRFRSGSVPQRASDILREHRAIAQALQDRDAERAEQLMREHIRSSCDNMIRNYDIAEAARQDEAAAASETVGRVRKRRRKLSAA